MDALGQIARKMPQNIKNSSDRVMQILTKKWDMLPDNSRLICPLFECMEDIALALEEKF